MKSDWQKRHASDYIWWKVNTPIGEFVFSFDKQKEYNLFRDYPKALSKKELALFNKENPKWAEFFADRLER